MKVENAAGDKGYILSVNTNDGKWKFWMENEEGEGMDMSENDIFDAMDEYFKKHF